MHKTRHSKKAVTGKAAPRFKVGDRVRVSRLLDTMTTPELVGLVGTINEVDDIIIPPIDEHPAHRLQVNYYVDDHYMHEEELEPAPQDGETIEAREESI